MEDGGNNNGHGLDRSVSDTTMILGEDIASSPSSALSTSTSFPSSSSTLNLPETRHISRLSLLDAVLESDLTALEQDENVQRAMNRTDIFKELAWFFKTIDRQTAIVMGVMAGVIALGLSLLDYYYVSHVPQSWIGDVPPVLDSPLITEMTLWEEVSSQVMGPRGIVAMSMGFSAITSGLTGFGFALVSTALLTQNAWVANSSVINVIQPMAAIYGVLMGVTMVLPEYKKVNVRSLVPIMSSSMLALPFGTALLSHVNEALLLKSLGGLIIGFVVYLLSGLKPPKWFSSTPGAVFWGSMAGLFGAAFGSFGPFLAFYAQSTDWPPEEFRRNVLAIVLVNSIVIMGMDYSSGRLDDYYLWEFVKTSLPFVAAGLAGGRWLGRIIDPKGFKNIVLATVGFMGIRLLMSH